MSVDQAGYRAADYTHYGSSAFNSRLFHAIRSMSKLYTFIEDSLSKFNDDLRKKLINIIPFDGNTMYHFAGLDADFDVTDFDRVNPECLKMITCFIAAISTLGVRDEKKKNFIDAAIKNIFNDITGRSDHLLKCLATLAHEYRVHISDEKPDEEIILKICDILKLNYQYYRIYIIALNKLLLVTIPNNSKIPEFLDMLKVLNATMMLCDLAEFYCNPTRDLGPEYTTIYVNNKLIDVSKRPELKDLILNEFTNVYASFVPQAEYNVRFPETRSS